MAVNTHTVLISIKQMGSRKVTRQLMGLTAALAAVGYAAVGMAKTIVRAADEMTNLGNKSRVFARNQGEAANRMATVVQVSRTMNMELAGVADVMQRVSMSADQVGLSNEQVTMMVSNLSKATMLSGATAQEATGALRQFGQALAANRLSGQELNSILEQTPMIARLIADSMGVAVGELRALGKAGHITAEVMKKALGGSIDDLNEKFSKFEFPISSLIVSFNRELTILIANVSKATGVGELFKTVIKTMVTFLEDLNHSFATGGQMAQVFTQAVAFAGRMVMVLSGALAVFTAGSLLKFITGMTSVASAVGVASRSMIGLTAIIRMNPIGLAVSGAMLAASAFWAWSGATDAVVEPMTELDQAQMALAATTSGNTGEIERWARALNVSTEKLRDHAKALAEVADNKRTMTSDLGNFEFSILPGESNQEAFNRAIDAQIGTLRSKAAALRAELDFGGGSAFGLSAVTYELRAVSAEVERLNKIADHGNDVYDTLANTLADDVKAAVTTLRDDFDETFDSTQLLTRLFETAGKRTGEWAKELKKLEGSDEIFRRIYEGGLNQLAKELPVVNGQIDKTSIQFDNLRKASEFLMIPLSEITEYTDLETKLLEDQARAAADVLRVQREKNQLMQMGAQALDGIAQADLAYTNAMDQLNAAQERVNLSSRERLEIEERLLELRRQSVLGAVSDASGGHPFAQMAQNDVKFGQDMDVMNNIPGGDMEAIGLTQEQMDQMKLFRENQHMQNQQLLEDQNAMYELNQALFNSEAEWATIREGMFASMREGFLSAARPALDLSGNISKLTASVVGGLSNALTDMAMTGKANFKELGLSFLRMITQMIIQMTIMMALIMVISALPGGAAMLNLMGMGAGFAGVASTGGNVAMNTTGGNSMEAHAAAGRPMRGGEAYLVGERGPELFVPPMSGSLKSNAEITGMGQKGPTVNIVNVTSQEDVVNVLGTDEAEAAILNVIRNNSDMIRGMA
jgi:lambda family phage tail tape measure protein